MSTNLIRNLSDLASYVGASDATVDSIGRRLFKDTECGVSFGLCDKSCARTVARTFVVMFAPSIAGWRLLSWRTAHGARQPFATMPAALRDYLTLSDRGAADYDPRTIDAPEIVKRSLAGSVVRLTIRIDVPAAAPARPGVYVAGYAEGSDGQPIAHELAFPFATSVWDATLAAADRDGCDLWSAVNE